MAPAARRLRIALYGAPNQNVTTDVAALYRQSGVTDVWISYLQGAFAVDCCKSKTDGGAAFRKGGLHGGLVSLQQAKQEKLLETYASKGIRSWFFRTGCPRL